MEDFKYLIRDILPCWYELSWKDSPVKPAIIVRVHKDFAEKFQEIPPSAPMPSALKKNFEFKSFCGSLRENFGFEEAFKKLPEEDEFVSFSVDLPKIRKEETVECRTCNGSGKDQLDDEICFSCKGKGRKGIIDWHDAFAVSASFTIFSAVTFYSEIETSARVPQLLTFQTCTIADLHGGSLSGIYGIPLVKWLSSFKGNIPEMIEAMMRAYDYMLELHDFDKYRFQSSVDYDDGRLNVSCPGNACGLNPSSSSDLRDGQGYKFSCRNTDSPLQQLTLLAGLAALHDRARKEIKE